MKKGILALIFGLVLTVTGCTTNTDQPKDVTLVEEETTVETEVQTDKTYESDVFAFNYPEKYTFDGKGLWDADGYISHKNPPAECSTCQIPAIEIVSEKTTKTLEEFILEKHTISGKTLDEVSIPNSKVKLGDNEFIKVEISDMLTETGYYTKNGDNIVGFLVYDIREGSDNDELKNIVASLKFK